MSNSTQNKFRDFVESPDAELMLKVAKSSQKKMDDMVKDVKQDTQNDWVKRFNDEFPCLMHFRPNKKSYGYSEVGNDVKAFIAKLLADARKEVYREIAGHFIKICGDDVLATQKEERV